jgi:hypothetical protein
MPKTTWEAKFLRFNCLSPADVVETWTIEPAEMRWSRTPDECTMWLVLPFIRGFFWGISASGWVHSPRIRQFVKGPAVPSVDERWEPGVK